MANKVPLDVPAAAVRLSLWLVLWLLTQVDFLRHKHIRGRGWQLQRGLTGLLTLEVLKQLLQLIFSLVKPPNTGLLGSYVVLADLADAWWLALLLHISCGYSITRNKLGELKGRVLGLPITYCVLILAVDIVILMDNPSAFYSFSYEVPDPSSAPSDEADSDSSQPRFMVLILLFAAVASLLCWVMGVMFVFEFVKDECESLESGLKRAEELREGVEGGNEPGAPNFDGVGDPDDSAVHTAQDGAPESNADSSLYDVKTIEDAVSHRDKQQLLRRFRAGVYCYALAYAFVVIMPVFASDSTFLPQTILLIYNIIMWGFTAWLVWIFRLREDNPYLLLGNNGCVMGGGAAADGTGLDASQLDTELGVLSPNGDTMVTRLVGGSQLRSDARTIDPDDITHFTIADEDEDEEAGAAAGLAGVPRIEQADDTGTPSGHIKQSALSMWPRRGSSGDHND
mmetsp:Transcript_22196/g.61594  ORF Transcript_22196/g.61594 Transcript_22196/m.61594 type:complete len:454 (-) Transcript_22196:263-1624(-)